MNAPMPTALGRERIQSLSADMLDRERWSREVLGAYQRERLRETLRHAIAHSPHYRRVVGDVGNGDIDLRRLPILTKTTLMAHFDRIVTDPRLRLTSIERHLAGAAAADPMFGEYRAVASGGGSGERGIVVYDRLAWERAIASVLRLMSIQAVPPGARVVSIGSPSPLHLTNRLFGALRADRAEVPRLAVTTPMPEIVTALNAYRPEVVMTYPSFIRRLAEEQRAGRLQIAPRQFCATAETLAPDVRALARETWDAPVRVAYGTTETGPIATECPWNTGLHVAEDMMVVEVVDRNDQPVPAGTTGRRVLVTTLFNRALPLIRYALSDLVTVAEGPCPCGRPHLRLASIEGRGEDLVSLPARDGGRVTVHAFQFGTPLLRVPAIRQYQISPQPDGLAIRVVLREPAAGDVLGAARRAVEAELDRAGAIVETLTIETVDQIARAGTGAKEMLVAASA